MIDTKSLGLVWLAFFLVMPSVQARSLNPSTPIQAVQSAAASSEPVSNTAIKSSRVTRAENGSTPAAAMFTPYLDQIRQNLPEGWVMRLPSQLVGHSGATIAPDNYTVRVFSFITPPGLNVSLFRCDTGERSCLIGSFNVDSKHSADAQHALQRHQATHQSITLASDVQAYLLDGEKQTPPQPLSSVMWEQDGLLYTVSFAAQERQKLLYAAQSMANAQPLQAMATVTRTAIAADSQPFTPSQAQTSEFQSSQTQSSQRQSSQIPIVQALTPPTNQPAPPNRVPTVAAQTVQPNVHGQASYGQFVVPVLPLEPTPSIGLVTQPSAPSQANVPSQAKVPSQMALPMMSVIPSAPTVPIASTSTPIAKRSIPVAPVPDKESSLGETTILTDGIDQVTSISQLADVQPTDWAFQALQSLVERYGCLAGYPDKTYRGSRALTRYEFAAGLSACLDRVTDLIAAGTANLVKKDDLLAVQKLQEQFAAELATLRGRLDVLETRAATLEKQQFSTTTFLRGQVIFELATAGGGNPPGRGETNTIFAELTQLQFISSFTGRDLLRISLATGNFGGDGFAGSQSLNTNMALLAAQADASNQLQVNSLEYRFALNDRFVIAVQPVGFSLSSVLSPNSAYADAGQGALSRFAAFNPIYRIGNLDAGAGFDWLFSPKWRLQVAYGTRNANRPDEGFLGSDHSALGVQLLYKPTANFITGLTYINAYAADGRLDTFTGSNNADVSGGFNGPATIHALGATFRWRLSPTITLGAWGGGIVTDGTLGKIFRVITDRSVNLEELGSVTLSSTYLLSLGIADPFGRKGDLLAFMVGQPPKLNLGALIEREDDGTSIHFETFYRFQINDNISITPGFFYITDPGHISRNKDIFIGVLRTTFSF